MILFNLLAKGLILLGFFTTGPFLLKQYTIRYTDDRLEDKKVKVLSIIAEEGIESFFQGDAESGYGSYNLLKEEYISLEKIEDSPLSDTIFNEERIIEDEVVSYRVLAYRFREDDTMYLLEIGRSLAMIQQVEKGISTFIRIAFIVFILLSIFLDGTYHTILLRPFHKIIYEKLPGIKEPNQYSLEPLKTRTYDFKVLDDAINNMMHRIQQAFNREREFIEHASHELRTPISVLQSKVENMLAETNLESQEEERLLDMQKTIQKFKHLVNSLLLISKIGNAQFLKNEEVDLGDIINELAEEWGPIAREKGLDFKLVQGESLRIQNSNSSMVLIMIQNALINAIRYTPAPGAVGLTVAADQDAVRVEVNDTGEGIPDELLEQVKDGVVFLKDARSEKSGFGLKIMNKISAYLNVKLTIDSTPGGTTVRFVFNGQA